MQFLSSGADSPAVAAFAAVVDQVEKRLPPGRAVPPRPVFRSTARVALQEATDRMVWNGFGFFIILSPIQIHAIPGWIAGSAT